MLSFWSSSMEMQWLNVECIGLWVERSTFETYNLVSVLCSGPKTFPSQCLCPPKNIGEHWQIVREAWWNAGVNPCNGPASNLGEEQWYSWLAHALETMISSGWVGHFAPVQTFEAQHRLHTDIFNFALSLIAIVVPILSIIFYFQRLEVFKMWFNRKFVDELNWWYNFVRQEIFWWLV